jgi:hypothetical protein
MNAEGSRDSHSEFQRAAQVKEQYEQSLLAKENVVGVGVGIRKRAGEYTGEVALIVMVRRKLPASELSPEDLLPEEIDGIPVDIQEVGAIDAH